MFATLLHAEPRELLSLKVLLQNCYPVQYN